MSEQSTQSVQQLPPSAQMFQYIISLMTPQAIHIAAKLGIADLVARAPATVEELAATTKSHAPSLARLLKFLTSLGIFSEDVSGKYHQTSLSDTLRRDHPQSTRGFAILWGSGLVWKSFGDGSASVQSCVRDVFFRILVCSFRRCGNLQRRHDFLIFHGRATDHRRIRFFRVQPNRRRRRWRRRSATRNPVCEPQTSRCAHRSAVGRQGCRFVTQRVPRLAVRNRRR